MEMNFVESNPDPGEGGDGGDGIARAGVAFAAGGAEAGESSANSGGAGVAGTASRGRMLQSQIERLFDDAARALSRKNISGFSVISKTALNRGRNSRGGAGCGLDARVADERVGEEGNSCSAFAWARSWICPLTRRGSLFSTNPRFRCGRFTWRWRAHCAGRIEHSRWLLYRARRDLHAADVCECWRVRRRRHHDRFARAGGELRAGWEALPYFRGGADRRRA